MPDQLQKFIEEMENKAKEIAKTKIPEILKKFKNAPFETPKNYDEGLDQAIEVLASIQKLRDITTSIKTMAIQYRHNTKRLWEMGRSMLLLKDLEMENYGTQTLKDAAIKMKLKITYDAYTKSEAWIEEAQVVYDNVVAKYNTVSRQIAVLEMKMQLGEIESRRRKFQK